MSKLDVYGVLFFAFEAYVAQAGEEAGTLKSFACRGPYREFGVRFENEGSKGSVVITERYQGEGAGDPAGLSTLGLPMQMGHSYSLAFRFLMSGFCSHKPMDFA